MLLAPQGKRPSDDERKPCEECGRLTDPYGRCSRRTCPGFIKLWAGDTRAWVQANAQALAPEGRIDMLTLTAPGVAYGLTWDRGRCTHPSSTKCSGSIGCRVTPAAADQWNDTAPARLTALLNAAHTRTCRELRRTRPEWLAIWEEQARGVLHPHILFAAKDRSYVRALAKNLRELAPRHGFGDQINFRPCGKGRSSGAAYLYKTVRYVTKSTATPEESAQLRGLLDGPLQRRPFMRASPKLTARSKGTMRNLRFRRYLYARRGLRDLTLPAIDICRQMKEADDRRRRDEETIVRRLFVTFEDPGPYYRPVAIPRHTPWWSLSEV